MEPKEADISTRVTLVELGEEQNIENIRDLDKRMLAQERNWRSARQLLNSLGNNKAERWIAITITIINLLILLLKD